MAYLADRLFLHVNATHRDIALLFSLGPRGLSFPCLLSHRQPFICQLTVLMCFPKLDEWGPGGRDFHFRLHMEQPSCLKTYSLRLIQLLSVSSVLAIARAVQHCAVFSSSISQAGAVFSTCYNHLRSSHDLPTSILLLPL